MDKNIIWGCRTFESHCQYLKATATNFYKILGEIYEQEPELFEKGVAATFECALKKHKFQWAKRSEADGFRYEFVLSTKDFTPGLTIKIKKGLSKYDGELTGEGQWDHHFFFGLIKCFKEGIALETILKNICSEKGFRLGWGQIHNLDYTMIDFETIKAGCGAPYTQKENDLRKKVIETQKAVREFVKSLPKITWGKEDMIKVRDQFDSLVEENEKAWLAFQRFNIEINKTENFDNWVSIVDKLDINAEEKKVTRKPKAKKVKKVEKIEGGENGEDNKVEIINAEVIKEVSEVPEKAKGFETFETFEDFEGIKLSWKVVVEKMIETNEVFEAPKLEKPVIQKVDSPKPLTEREKVIQRINDLKKLLAEEEKILDEIDEANKIEAGKAFLQKINQDGKDTIKAQIRQARKQEFLKDLRNEVKKANDLWKAKREKEKVVVNVESEKRIQDLEKRLEILEKENAKRINDLENRVETLEKVKNKRIQDLENQIEAYKKGQEKWKQLVKKAPNTSKSVANKQIIHLQACIDKLNRELIEINV